MPRDYAFAIGPAERGIRLDQFLSRRLPDIVSRTTIQHLIRSGAVTVNSEAVKVHYKLRLADAVAVTVDQLPAKPSAIELIPQNIQLDVVHEDADVLVVNKPAGLVTHPAPGHWDGTLVNAVLWHLQQPAPDAQTLPRAGIVHRLDKDTSGLLMIAKTDQALLLLSRQMKARTIHREYLCVVQGHLPMDSGTVEASIGRHATNRKVMTVRHLDGRRAVTHYRVIARNHIDMPEQAGLHASRDGRLACTLLALKLDTGRTHQIRVHMAHMGYPVLGDVIYSAHPASFWQVLEVERQLLHAYRLSFRHPTSNKWVTLDAPIPDDFARWCDAPARRLLREPFPGHDRAG